MVSENNCLSAVLQEYSGDILPTYELFLRIIFYISQFNPVGWIEFQFVN